MAISTDGIAIGEARLTQPVAGPKQGHVPYLDGIRGLAALYVALTHITSYLPPGVGGKLFNFLMGGGHLAVDVFIVLSGYSLMLGAMGGREFPVGRFIAKRALRILPPYYAALALSALALWPFFGVPGVAFWGTINAPNANSLIPQLLLFQEWCGHNTIDILNGVDWSVAVEWKIYFLFPFLATCVMTRGVGRTVLWALGLSYAVFWVLYVKNWLNPDPYGVSTYYVGLFTAGMGTAYCLRNGLYATLFKSRALSAATLVFTVGVFLIIFKKHSMLQIGSFFGGGLTCCLLAYLYQYPLSFLGKLLSFRALDWLGRRSFSLYLVHAVAFVLVQGYVIGPFVTSHKVFWIYLLMVPAAVALACLFYRLVELPSMVLSKRVGKTRRVSAGG